MPLWICSCPASALNSSIRAFTSWRVTRSRAAIEARSTWSTHRGVRLDGAVRNVDAEVALRLEHREPQPPLEHAPCARATTAAPSARRRSGWPGRRGSRACSRTRLSQPERARDHAPGRWTSPRAAASAMSVRWWEPRSRIAATRAYASARASSRVAPSADHREHPAAGRDDASRRRPARCRRAARRSARRRPSIGSPVTRRRGVALGGDHHGDGALVATSAAASTCVQRAGGRGVQQPAQRRLQPGQHHLRLRVAEAGVELDHPEPARGQRQPGVEQAGERRAAAAPSRRRSAAAPAPARRRPGPGGAHGSGEYAPMPPVFGPVSPSPTRLKSCAGCSGTTVVAVGDREERHLRAVEVLLDHHPLAGGGVRQRLVAVVGHDDALAGGEPVVLDDVRGAELVEGVGDLLGRRRRPGPSRSARRPRPSRPWRRPCCPRAARPAR